MKQNNKLSFQIDTKAIVLLFLVNVSFVTYLFFLACYNRLSQDDFLFLKSVQQSGCINLVKWAYFFQSGRFTHYSYISVVFLSIIKSGQFFFIPVLIWLINFFILKYLLDRVLNVNSFLISNLSALFLNIFIITNYEFTAFYWICATFYYIQPLLILLLFVFINQKSITKFQYVLFVFIALLLSGSSEIFVPFCLIFLVLNFSYYYFKHNRDLFLTFSDKRTKKIIVSILILLIGFIIVVIAPGNYIRAKEVIFHHPKNLFEFLKIALQSFVLFFYLLVFKLPYYSILIFISYLIGIKNRTIFLCRFNYTRFLLVSWCGYLLFILLNVLPTAYLMSGFGFQRIYTSTIFFSMVFFVVQGFMLGVQTTHSVHVPLFQKLILINLVVLILIMTVNIVVDIPVAKKYSQSDVERTNLLLELKRNQHKGLVKLAPLFKPYTYTLKYLILREKQPMLYYSNEIETDSGSYPNMCIRSYYELEYPVSLRINK